MIDIVIDTCTLEHASNPSCNYFEHSVDFINRMLTNSIKCAVDEGFSLDESGNQSYIGYEYITHLQPGTPGYILIREMAINDRIVFVPSKTPTKVKNYIKQIIRNKRDRTFLKVAYNSQEKVLTSHDFTDYQSEKRKTIQKDFNVKIVTAEEIIDNL